MADSSRPDAQTCHRKAVLQGLASAGTFGAGPPSADGRKRFSAALAGRTMPVGRLELTSCSEPLYATRRLVLASIMRQSQVSAAFRSLTCQSSTSVPPRSRRSTLPATQVVQKRTLLALGATHVGGPPPTSSQGRSSKPDATFHPARWAAQAAKRISRDPPRLPRDRHRPVSVPSSAFCRRRQSLQNCLSPGKDGSRLGAAAEDVPPNVFAGPELTLMVTAGEKHITPPYRTSVGMLSTSMTSRHACGVEGETCRA